MVDIGTPRSFAARAAVYAPRGLFGFPGLFSLPSDSSTMRAGGGVALLLRTAATVAIDSCALKRASPIAVELSGRRLSRAAMVAWCCVVGDTSTLAVPANA